MPDFSELKFIDLFCGIGGFHLALRHLGAKCVLACDTDKRCREVYQANFGIVPEPDVRKLKPEEMPDFDIICGGFPCQPFSNAGKKLTLDDDRGLLFDEIMRLASAKRPKFMFLENVKHILKVQSGEVFEYIKGKLGHTGYNLQIFRMSPHEYGIPQQRERIYFACIRNDIYNGSDTPLIRQPGAVLDFESYLDPSEECQEYKISAELNSVLEAWDEMIAIFQEDERLSPTILVNEFYKNYTAEEYSNLADWRRDYIEKNRPLYIKYKPHWDSWYERHKEILCKREVYCKLEWQVGLKKPNDSIFNYFIQIRQSGIRVRRREYFPTLVAISQIPIYASQRRYITPRECLRLQSFPDNFIMSADDRATYKQAGNAVNVENAGNVIESILKAYGYS